MGIGGRGKGKGGVKKWINTQTKGSLRGKRQFSLRERRERSGKGVGYKNYEV